MIRSFVLILLRDIPSKGVTPTIFQPVYPTVFTVTVSYTHLDVYKRQL